MSRSDGSDEGLEALKLKMTSEQQSQMAALVAQEVKRRNKARSAEIAQTKKSQVKNASISSKLSNDDVREMYNGFSDKIRKLRVENAIKVRQGAKSDSSPYRFKKCAEIFCSNLKIGLTKISQKAKGLHWTKEFALPVAHLTLFSGVFTIGLLKLSMGGHIASDINSEKADLLAKSSIVDESMIGDNSERGSMRARLAPVHVMPGYITPEYVAPKYVTESTQEAIVGVPSQREELLTKLDDRRAELENRRIELDNREQELVARDKAVTMRLSELKELTQKVEEQLALREKDQADRLEQMADVYASMQPKDAATLLEKLDDDIALRLLSYLPGKRMGQILSLMDQSRAVELTKQLSGRKNGKFK